MVLGILITVTFELNDLLGDYKCFFKIELEDTARYATLNTHITVLPYTGTNFTEKRCS